MWYTILITLAVDAGGLLLLYALLRERVRRATSAHAQIAEIREEVSRLLVELNQTTDRNILLLEDRIGRLNDLLAAADKKVGLLQREIEKHDVGARIYSRIARPAAPASSPSAPVPQSSPSPVGPPGAGPAPTLAVELSAPATRPSGGAEGAREGSPDRARSARLRGAEPEGAGASPEAAGDLQQRVLMLHRSGFSAGLIAGRVGAPVGEVELIIALEERRQSSRGPGAAVPPRQGRGA